jgi:hypothetical protein
MSSPLPPHRRRATRLRFLLATLLLPAAACGGDAGSRPSGSDGEGTLTLAEQTLVVRTSFCVADGGRAAAVGHGTSDEGPFVVVVRSPGSASVKFGVHGELDTPPPGATWLTASGTVRLRAGDGRIEGGGDLRSMAAADPTDTRSVTFDLRCSAQR